MKRLTLLIIAVLLVSGFVGVFVFEQNAAASGPTQIGGVINENTTWTSADSPYIIYKNTTLMPGKVLTIEAGTVVKFENNTRFNIRGTLIVNGTSSNRVLFTGNGTNYDYSYQTYINGKKTTYNGQGINYTIYVDKAMGGKINISYAKFENSSYVVLDTHYWYYIVGDIKDTLFENNFLSIRAGYTGMLPPQLTIKRCSFINNYAAIYSYYGTALCDDSLFQNNKIAYRGGGEVFNCTFIENELSTHMGHYGLKVRYSKYYNNTIGIWDAHSIKNTYVNNSIGIILEKMYYGVKILNNNIYNNTKYGLKMKNGAMDADVSSNWWGTTNTSKINESIYDVWDEANLYEAKYEPYLTSPAKMYNEPPVAYAGPDHTIKTNSWVEFPRTGSYDPDDDKLQQFWDWGNGYTWGWLDYPWLYGYIRYSYSTAGNYTVTLKISDGEYISTDTCIITVKDPPVAVGPLYLKAVINETVYFDGSGSYDPTGLNLTYHWDFGDGYNTGWSTDCNATHVYNKTGTYMALLTVDNGEFQDYDSLNVYIRPVGGYYAPEAEAGPDQDVAVNKTVNFNGGNSWDSDGDQLQYKWDFGDGTNTSWSNQSTTTHSYSNVGNYTVTLVVFDGKHTDNDTCVIRVNNNPPVAHVGSDQTVKVDTWVYFDAYKSYDPDGDTISYKWDFDDGTGTGWLSSYTTSHKYSSPGYYDVKLTVSDGRTTDDDYCKITITDASGNSMPIADAGADKYIGANRTVNFQGSGSYDPDSDPLTYKWDFGDGTSTNYSSSSSISHFYSKTGTYTVTLYVNDGSLTGTDTSLVYVTSNGSNSAPLANAGADLSVYVNNSVTFDGSGSSDPEDDTLTYKWNFGDGTSTSWQSQSSATHTYTEVGNYTVTLFVSDGSLTDSDTCIVQVSKNGTSSFFNLFISFYSPENSQIVSGLFQVLGTAYSNPGNILDIQLKIDDGNYEVTTPSKRTIKIYNEEIGVFEDVSVDDWSAWGYSWNTTLFKNGIHSLTAKVTNDLNNTDIEEIVVIVNNDVSGKEYNSAPVANAGPNQTVLRNQNVTFDGSDSYDPDGDNLTYRWDFGDGVSTLPLANPQAIHQFNQLGTYTVTLTVSDGELEDTDTCTIEVKSQLTPDLNHPPEFKSSPPTSAEVGKGWTYEPILTDPDIDDTITITLSFGPDGMVFSSGVLSWIPNSEQVGTNYVVLEATDGSVRVYQGFNITVTGDGSSKNQTPPKITSTKPIQDSTNVPLDDTEIIIEFSTPMNANSVEDALSVSPTLDYSLFWNSDYTELIIAISADLPENTLIIISIGEGAKNLNGINLESAFELKFTTFDGSPTIDDDSKKSDDVKLSMQNFSAIILVIAVLAAIIIVLFYMFFLQKIVRKKDVEDRDLRELDERKEIGGGKLSEDYVVPTEFPEDNKVIEELKEKALVKKKPSDFGMTKSEMLIKAQAKYQKGEISEATYNSIAEEIREK